MLLLRATSIGYKTNDLEVWTEEQEGIKLESMLDTLKEREREELMGIGDQSEYMNEINWPGKKLKKGYEIEKLFAHKEDDEDKLTWVPGVVTNVLSRNDEKIVATIKWDEKMIGDGE